MVSSIYRYGNSKIGYPLPFTPKNICTPTPRPGNPNSVTNNKNYEENGNNGIFGKDDLNSNIKKYDKIINELKINIEANAVKFDGSNDNLNLELNLIGENSSSNDIGKQYLELESNKRKFMVSPNSPFVPHIKSMKNNN